MILDLMNGHTLCGFRDKKDRGHRIWRKKSGMTQSKMISLKADKTGLLTAL